MTEPEMASRTASRPLPAAAFPPPAAGLVPAAPARDPYLLYLGRLGSADSRRVMRICLDHIARMLTGDHLDNPAVTGQGQPWHHLRYEHTAWIREQIDEMDWSPAYRNKHLAALRGVLKEAWKLGLLSTDDHQRAVALAPFTGHREPAGQHLPDTVIGALIAACDADRSSAGAITSAGLRDAAIIAVLDACGLRRAELVSLQYADYDRARRMLTVIGKGDKQRRIPVNSFAARRLEAWLASRGTHRGPLFPRLTRGGTVRTAPDGRPWQMNPQAVRDILAKRTEQAATTPVRPHDLRRTFISNLLPQADAIMTARLAGHASPSTTLRYDVRPDEEARDAVERLRVPTVTPLLSTTPAEPRPDATT
ncbi:tyrosine-type recombinase/integrase [Nonomuraea sp. NPDC049655]|uniref:tyrosine-type recombinase/integrase n=1 Tax=Nonomuraea sp. NPDC049655 TaxID=3364355 RepID=UPI0037B703CB